MTPIFDSIVLMFRDLRQAEDRLEVAMHELLSSFFRFLKDSHRGMFRCTRRLRMRAERNRRKRIWKLSWTLRIKPTLLIGGRTKYLTRRLPEPFNRNWVGSIAKDWAIVNGYQKIDRRRVTLNSLHSQVLDALRRLRLSFLHRWTPRARDQDRVEADRLIGRTELGLRGMDLRPVPGIQAFCHELRRVEAELGLFVDDFRRTFARHPAINFEAALRPTKGGTLRLYWGFPEIVQTSEGCRTLTDYISGGPSDLWMRKHRIGPAFRKEVGAFLKRLRPIERRYRKLVGYLGAHRQRVGKLLSRIEKLNLPSGSPAFPWRGNGGHWNIRTAQ